MNQKIIEKIAFTLSISEKQAKETLLLLEEGATIPFISRYRKERTGDLDEVQVAEIKRLYDELSEVESRRVYILETIDKQGKLTLELKEKILSALDLQKLEDLYLPYKVKKKTKSEVARKLGLEPLAKTIFEQTDISLSAVVKKYITKEVEDADAALAGARDIIAEWVNEDEEARANIRDLFESQAKISSKVIKSKAKEAAKYKDYFDSVEFLKDCPSHRILAMRRGAEEKFLRISIQPSEQLALGRLSKIFIKGSSDSSDQVEVAVEDSYKRLLGKSIETEYMKLAKEKADTDAIDVFVVNLRQLLLAAPLGQKLVLAIDLGFRTGCKLVALDELGELKENSVMYLLGNSTKEAEAIIRDLVDRHQTEAIAIGNGTASRETEKFIKDLDLGKDVFMVSENGASVYSASDVAREEFPDKDVTIRGAVSIGRRLMDPLAELVKVDPKSVGVGQYQHDVDQKKLKQSLEQTVESCVNLVGVNLNTASKHILTYVSGLGPVLAKNIISYRNENGAFRRRKELLKVNKLGSKAFEQCAGFLRISEAPNPLDNSAVHPESYELVKAMAGDLDSSVKELIGNEALIKKIDLSKYVTEEVGMPTLKDIIEELEKPGRDPRGVAESFSFDERVNEISDLEKGMVLPGIITNITNFGAFVDIGVHQDGLVHISELADTYVSNPADIVSLHQKVKVKVMDIDIDRKRIALGMRL